MSFTPFVLLSWKLQQFIGFHEDFKVLYLKISRQKASSNLECFQVIVTEQLHTSA